MKALFKQILVQPIKPEEKKSPTGLIMPVGNESETRGKVVSVGSEVVEGPEEGSVVIYGQNKGVKVSVDGQNYVLLHKDDVYLTI